MIVTSPSGNAQVMGAARPETFGPFGGWATDTFTDRAVTLEGANAISAWHSASTLITWPFAGLPLRTYDETDPKAPIEVVGGYTAPMLRDQPNNEYHASVFWPAIARACVNRSNAYIAKYKDERGIVVAIHPIHPDRVFPFRDRDGKKWFQVYNHGMRGGQNSIDYFDSSQITHLICHPDEEALMGISLVSQMRQRLGVAQSASEFQQRNYSQGTIASGILKAEASFHSLTKERREELALDWRAKHTGSRAAHGVVILEPGWDYQPISLTHQDQQFMEQMSYSVDEIASWLHIPSSRLNGKGSKDTYKNATQDDLAVVKWAMMPWAAWIEGGLKADPDLFGPLSRWRPRFDFDELLRADAETRSKIADTRIKNSSWSPDEYRASEREAPRGGVGAKFTDELAAEGVSRMGTSVAAPAGDAPTPQGAE